MTALRYSQSQTASPEPTSNSCGTPLLQLSISSENGGQSSLNEPYATYLTSRHVRCSDHEQTKFAGSRMGCKDLLQNPIESELKAEQVCPRLLGRSVDLIWLARSVAYAERADAKRRKDSASWLMLNQSLGLARLRAGWEYYNAKQS